MSAPTSIASSPAGAPAVHAVHAAATSHFDGVLTDLAARAVLTGFYETHQGEIDQLVATAAPRSSHTA